MDFPIDVKPGDRFELASHNSVRLLSVQPDPIDPSEPYFEYGGTGAVLQLQDLRSGNFHALKIFDPRFQDDGQVQYAENLTKLQLHNFILVADRTVITPQNHHKLIEKFNALKHSLFMPWIPGYTWQEVLIDNKNRKTKPKFSPNQCFEFAANLCVLLKLLEDKKCAHCDICSNNIIVDPTTNKVELIDIEDMYGPGFRKSPSFVGGQKGYTHQKHNQEHQWCQESDRFGGAILIAEMATWYSQSVRDLSGSESYFSSNEDLQKSSVPFQTLLSTLREQTSQKIAELFVDTWDSTNLRECPPMSEWYREFAKVANTKNIHIEGLLIGNSVPSEPLVKGRRSITLDVTIDPIGDADDTSNTHQPIEMHRRSIGFDDVPIKSSTDENMQPTTSSIKGRRRVQMEDSSRYISNSGNAGTITPRSMPTPGASSPKSRVTPPASSLDSMTSNKSTNRLPKVVTTIFWTLVAIVVTVVMLNFIFPDLFPSIIQFIQRIADSLLP